MPMSGAQKHGKASGDKRNTRVTTRNSTPDGSVEYMPTPTSRSMRPVTTPGHFRGMDSSSDMSDSDFAPDVNCKQVAGFHQICSDEESDTGMDDVSEFELEYTSDLEDLAEIQDEVEEFETASTLALSKSDDDSENANEAPGFDEVSDVDDHDREALFDGNIAPDDYYRAGIQSTRPGDYMRKEYSKGTEKLIIHSEHTWQRFCAKILQKKDWQQQLARINFQTVRGFLDWYLGQRTGRRGQFKRTVRSKGSLVTFWCCFRLAFQRVTNRKIDSQIDRDMMHNALVQLGKRHKLTHKRRQNRSMTLEDLKLQIETTLQTTEKGFKLGEMRILAVLFLLLLAPQGSRPKSILELRFRDIQLKLVRNPTDKEGPPNLVIELCLEYTKRYLGPKAVKTFVIPEIMYDPSLLLSPHVFLLAILFRHSAFQSHSLNTNPHELCDLRPHPDTKELLLPLRDEIQSCYVFRQCVKTSIGYVMSQKAITPNMMGSWVQRVGRILGFERNTICYTLRYMAGNNLDQDATISEDMRNHVMDHAPHSDTFSKHYINNHVPIDTWAVHLRTKPQQELIKQVTSHGSSSDPRRPIRLTNDQTEALKSDPKYAKLSAVLFDLPRNSKKRREVHNERKARWERLKDIALRKVREEWSKEQAVKDIEHQIQGRELAPSTPRTSTPMSPAQQRMMEALRAPLIHNLKAQYQRRTDAIRALVAYGHVEEPLSVTLSKNIKGTQQPPPPPEAQLSDPLERARELRASVFGQVDEVRRCYICVWKALTLDPDDPNLAKLTRPFYNHLSLSRHFGAVHLKWIEDDDTGVCPICVPVVLLDNKQHLQNHTEAVHGINTEQFLRKM